MRFCFQRNPVTLSVLMWVSEVIDKNSEEEGISGGRAGIGVQGKGVISALLSLEAMLVFCCCCNTFCGLKHKCNMLDL